MTDDRGFIRTAHFTNAELREIAFESVSLTAKTFMDRVREWDESIPDPHGIGVIPTSLDGES